MHAKRACRPALHEGHAHSLAGGAGAWALREDVYRDTNGKQLRGPNGREVNATAASTAGSSPLIGSSAPAVKSGESHESREFLKSEVTFSPTPDRTGTNTHLIKHVTTAHSMLTKL